MENFIWTDELVAEYAEFYRVNQGKNIEMWGKDCLKEFIRQFKPEHRKEESKNTTWGKSAMTSEPKKYPKGIISFEHGVGGTSSLSGTPTDEYYQDWCHSFLGQSVKYKIHSVKNKHGEVLTQGEECTDGGIRMVIDRFGIYDLNIFAFTDNGRFNIDHLTKVEKQLLFKTIDGAEILSGTDTTVFMIHKDQMTIAPYIVSPNFRPTETSNYAFQNPNRVFFKERINAEKWVSENKKSISYKELKEYTRCATAIRERGLDFITIDGLLEHFKPK